AFDISVDDVGQVVQGKANSVIGHPSLGVVVGTDLGGPVTTGNHGIPLGGIGLQLFSQLLLIQPRAQYAEGLFLVLVLGLLILALGQQSGVNVGKAYGGIGGVHRLPSRP